MFQWLLRLLESHYLYSIKRGPLFIIKWAMISELGTFVRNCARSWSPLTGNSVFTDHWLWSLRIRKVSTHNMDIFFPLPISLEAKSPHFWVNLCPGGSAAHQPFPCHTLGLFSPSAPWRNLKCISIRFRNTNFSLFPLLSPLPVHHSAEPTAKADVGNISNSSLLGNLLKFYF